MLVLGHEQYLEDIKRLSYAFFNHSPYQTLGIDEDRILAVIHDFLTGSKLERLVLLWLADEKPVGILAAATQVNLFNNQRYAGELIWWIDEEHRKSKAANEMRLAYEYWAKQVGCQFCTLVDLMGNLKTYYKRKGYEPRESTYLKVL